MVIRAELKYKVKIVKLKITRLNLALQLQKKKKLNTLVKTLYKAVCILEQFFC
jgi:hypothetical protein